MSDRTLLVIYNVVRRCVYTYIAGIGRQDQSDYILVSKMLYVLTGFSPALHRKPTGKVNERQREMRAIVVK